jgi:hypothetical protein
MSGVMDMGSAPVDSKEKVFGTGKAAKRQMAAQRTAICTRMW